MKKPIYLDHFSTTPVDSRVLEAMLPYFTEVFGNPASQTHCYGWEADEAVENARGELAKLIGASPKEIVFTSGASESNNLAIKGVADALAGQGNHIITLATEHKSVLETCLSLQTKGFDVTVLPVNADGLLDLERLISALTDRTILVSIMFANNEIGVIQPIDKIGKLLRERGILFHSDATQAVGKLSVDVSRDSIDLLSLSAHKFYGPKGIGALYIRRGVKLATQIHGGGQEHGIKSGTLNVPGIVGLGKAAWYARSEMGEESVHIGKLRDRLQRQILTGIDGVTVNGSLERRLPHNLNISFEGVDGESLLNSLKDIALSRGSTCSGNSFHPSHVLTAIGLPNQLAQATLRFGLGRSNTEQDIDFVADRVIQAVRNLRCKAMTR